MRFLIPSIAALSLALPTGSATTSLAAAITAATPIAIMLGAATPAEAQGRRHGGGHRAGGRGGFKSGGRHKANGGHSRDKGRHNVHQNANRHDGGHNHRPRPPHHRDVDSHHRHHGGGWDAGDFFAGVAAATAIGAIIATLPPDCSTYTYDDIPYRRCGDTWYRPQYSGSNVTYIVVEAPD